MYYRTLIALVALYSIPAPFVYGRTALRITAQNADGSQIQQFEAMLAVDGQQYTQWREANSGSVPFQEYDLKVRGVGRTEGEPNLITSAEVFVRAPGYATASKPLKIKGDVTRTVVVLREGRIVTLELRDESEREIPKDFHPLLLPARYRESGLYRWQRKEGDPSREFEQGNWYLLTRKMPGTYQLRVTDQTPELFLNIDDHDFLRAFESGPIAVSAAKDVPIVVTLPKTASLNVRLDFPQEVNDANLPIESVLVAVNRPKDKGSSTLFPISSEEFSDPTAEYSIAHLAPGPLYVSISTTSGHDVPFGQPDPGKFRAAGMVQVKSGERKEVVHAYKQFSERPFAGQKDVMIRVVDRRGDPVEGKEFEVQFSDEHFGTFSVEKGKIKQGKIHLADVRPTEGLEHPKRFTLVVNRRRVGRFAVPKSANQPQIERFQLPPDVGDEAVPLTVQSLDTSEPVSVEFANRITLLEFWATWCGPCQQPMNRLNEIARKKSGQWAERVQLISISIDESSEAAQRHLEGKNWLATRNLIDQQKTESEGTSPSFEGATAHDYLISGVPTALLIDSTGTIVYRGPPAALDLVAKVEKLLED